MKFTSYKIFTAAFTITILSLPVFNIFSKTPEVKIHFSPDIHDIIPDKTPVTIRIETSENSKPISSDIRFALTLPETDALFSTEYPVIEGSILNLGDVKTENGIFEFTTILPIRGEYSLKVTARPESKDSSSEISQSITHINAGENPDDLRNFTILSFILFSLGILSGFIFQKSRVFAK